MAAEIREGSPEETAGSTDPKQDSWLDALL